KEGGPRFLGLNQHAIRRGDVKLLHNGPFDPLELYDLGADARETRDLSKEHADLFREFSGLLQIEMQQAGRVPWLASQ
ncbi:MAG: N-acetylgalactosamine 6-sulfate sulfatase, partial [bacterium]|nr:N-acetylgalactosamine 6-sulfate sulfatase [bacterium]